MKIQKQSNLLKKITIAVVAVIFVVGGYLLYAYSTSSWPYEAHAETAQTNSRSEEEAQPQSNHEDTPPASAPKHNDTDKPEEKTPKKYDTPKNTAPTPKSSLTGVINYKNVSDGNLTIRNTIDQLVTSGTCTLTLTNSQTGKIVTKTADIIANPSSSTCKGFSIPVSELSPGKWRIAIDMVSGNNHGTLEATVSI